jgi:hypothetical protein
MVKKGNSAVDLGRWKSVPPSILSCPFSVHSGIVTRILGLLTRKLIDAKDVSASDNAFIEITTRKPIKMFFFKALG